MDISDFDTNFSSTNVSNLKILSQRQNHYGDLKLHYNLIKIDWILDEGPYNYPYEATSEELSNVYKEVIDLINNSIELSNINKDNHNTLVNFMNNGRSDKLISILVIKSFFDNDPIGHVNGEDDDDLYRLLVLVNTFIAFIYDFASPARFNLAIDCSHTISVLDFTSSIQDKYAIKYNQENKLTDYTMGLMEFNYGEVLCDLCPEIVKNCYPCSEIFNYLNHKIELSDTKNIYKYVDQLCILTKNLQSQYLRIVNLFESLDEYKQILKSSIITLLKSPQLSDIAYETNFNILILTFNDIFDEDIRFSQLLPNKTVVKNSDAEDNYGTSNYKYYLGDDMEYDSDKNNKNDYDDDKKRPDWVDLYYKTTYTDSNVINDNEEEEKESEESEEEEDIHNECQFNIQLPKYGFRYKLRSYMGLESSTRGSWHSFFRKFKLTK